MKFIYFDTSTYNKILEHSKQDSIIKAIQKNSVNEKLKILISFHNFEEFCHSKDVSKTTRLLNLAYSICNKKFLLTPEDLIKKELEFLVRGHNLNKEHIFSTDFHS